MPYLVKPSNDEGRINLLKTSLATSKSDSKLGNMLLSSETLQKIETAYADFESKLKALTGTLALRSREVREKNEAKSLLEMYIRDLWESVKRRVYRNKLPAEVLTFYKLPLDGTVPPTIIDKEILSLATQIIEGDKKAVAAGYAATVNPSADELATVLAATEKEFDDVAPADRQYNQAQEALAPIRNIADELIIDIIAELDYNLRKKEAETRRRIMRSYGVTYAYAKGEPQDEPAAPVTTK